MRRPAPQPEPDHRAPRPQQLPNRCVGASDQSHDPAPACAEALLATMRRSIEGPSHVFYIRARNNLSLPQRLLLGGRRCQPVAEILAMAGYLDDISAQGGAVPYGAQSQDRCGHGAALAFG